MDFTNLEEKAREATLDYGETESLVRFLNFQRERRGEPPIPADYGQLCELLSEIHPEVEFKLDGHRIVARVKDGAGGSLVDLIGFVNSNIHHLAATINFGSDSFEIVFRDDGIGVIKEDSWYEFFEHELDLEKIRRDCEDDRDAIINTALDGVRGVHITDGAVTIGELLTPLGYWKKDDNPAEVIRQWSSEALYHLLEKNREWINLRALGSNGEFNGKDLTPPMGSSQPAGSVSIEDEIRAWNSRLKAARGSLAGIFNRLVRDLPKVKTPWERILRDSLFRHARRKRKPDPSRPSRRWLALEGDLREREGVDLPFDRATRAARTGRIALAVDTSGSIDERLLKRFAAEVAAVLVQTEPMLRLIVCDAYVHQVQDFSGREGAKLLRGFEFKGGGGTDFRPAIAEAAKWKPDLLIYLTDLQGGAGAEPAFPVLWAVPEGIVAAPWGKVVELIK